MEVFPVPVASVRRMRVCLEATFSSTLFPRLGLGHPELVVAIYQHVVGLVVGRERPAAATGAFDAAWRDRMFCGGSCPLYDAPPCGSQYWVDVLPAGLGFIHRSVRRFNWLALVEHYAHTADVIDQLRECEVRK